MIHNIELPCNIDDICYTIEYSTNEGEIIIQNNIVRYFEVRDDGILPYGKKVGEFLLWGNSYKLISGLDGKVYYDKKEVEDALTKEKLRVID